MKRFWQAVAVQECDAGFSFTLDARMLKTPLGAELIVPNRKMADAIATEWRSVGEDIDPAAMPVTGFANAAVDRVAAERGIFIDAVSAYGESDLLCYRADSPEILIKRQAAIWDRYLAWVERYYGVTFTTVSGIMHHPQHPETLEKLRAAVAARTDFELAGLAKVAHLSGSLVITLALLEGEAPCDMLWDAVCLDEDWQAENWGADDYAIKHRLDRQTDFFAAAEFLRLC